MGGATPLSVDPPLSPEAIERLRTAQVEIASYAPAVLRLLATARIQARPPAQYQVLSRSAFTPDEVIQEIGRDSALGRHFADLEKHATLIAIRAMLDHGRNRSNPDDNRTF